MKGQRLLTTLLSVDYAAAFYGQPVRMCRSSASPIRFETRVRHFGNLEKWYRLQHVCRAQPQDKDTALACWNPRLRCIMGGIATLGALETSYLTVDKWLGTGAGVEAFCSTTGGGAGSCGSVLNSPYAYIPGTHVPLALLGAVAYASVAYLALSPIVRNGLGRDDGDNRVLLAALTTAMGVFSVILMTLLYGVLKQSCAFCVASAVFSISLATLAWLGGALPRDRARDGTAFSFGGGLATVALSLLLFTGVNHATANSNTANNFAGTAVGRSERLLAGTTSATSNAVKPPTITTSSSSRALDLSRNLQALDAKMYGAYWCSHCFDQKERLGREAMARVQYVECSKDGADSQNQLCRERDVPGYPTWEINGKLFPGEREIEELEELVQQARQ